MMISMNYLDEFVCIELLVLALSVDCFSRFERVLGACVLYCMYCARWMIPKGR